HGYAVSSLMDTAYWSSKTVIFKISSFKLYNAYTQIDINYAAGGNPRGLSAEEAWETIGIVPNAINKVEETLGTPIKEEPLDQTKLEDVGLTNHDIPLSFREVPSFDELEPQLLPNFSPLDVNLGDKRRTDPPIKPHSLDSFRMKVVAKSTINTPPSPHVASFYHKDMYSYYHPCIDDPKKRYRFKPGLLGHSRSLGVDFLKLEIIKDDWELEFKEVSFLERGLNSPVIFDEKKLGSS
ncbi:hypothetical protein Tco_0051319, partial [Tanacetum coccineum]